MMSLPPMQWVTWIAVTVAEIAVCLQIGLRADRRRRWASLFAFLLVLSLKDITRICNALVIHNAFADFYNYWAMSCAAEVCEVWIILQIAQKMFGITVLARKLIARSVTLMAVISGLLAISHVMLSSLLSWGTLCAVTARLSNAIALSWLLVLVVVILFSDRMSEWSADVRGVALGITLELTADSYIGWLRIAAQGKSGDLLDITKSLIFIISLAVWGFSIASPRPIESPYVSLFGALSEIERIPEIR